jgi:glycogen debranching enzyme
VHLLPKLERAVYAIGRGTKYGICLDENGFLVWTNKKKALTWMDAIVDDQPVTQRAGACVEIQALWYNALQTIEKLAQLTNYKLINLALFDQLEMLLEKNFEKNFWLEQEQYYADFIDLDNKPNKELRPNQLALYSLPFKLGNLERAQKVISIVEEKLLTPLGLRTLSSDSHQYIAEYQGVQKERDLAYHQGVIWSWLLILYYNALINTSNNSSKTREKIKAHLHNAWEEIKKRQILSIPELFSGENLQPAGTISQAWSVAAFIEGIMAYDRKASDGVAHNGVRGDGKLYNAKN